MSRPKFAPITSDLLARKGDARPWQPPGPNFAPVLAPPIGPAPTRWGSPARDAADEDMPHDDFVVLSTPHSHPMDDGVAAHDHMKRCGLKLTPDEYERLGIIGVKKGLSRHQILRQAFEQYMAVVQHEYQTECGCLSGQGCCHAC